jgi:signal transduction histidine kinase
VRAPPDRLRGLVEAGIAISSELSLDAVLQKIVETAAELTGARYAALGVIDRSGRELERFVTSGVDAEAHAAIGELPRGRGILGVLIRDQQTLRLHDLSEDPRSVGFPPHHPPMHTFLGVPILLRGVAYGNLYLTEKDGGEDFDEQDEELVQLLAAQAAVAIENARLYESATRWLHQLESLNEVGNALVGEVELEPLLALVAERLRALIGARLVHVALPLPSGSFRIAAVAGSPDEVERLTGWEIPAASKLARVAERRQRERVDSMIDDAEVDHGTARRLRANSALFVPLLVRDAAIGVIVAVDRSGPDTRFSSDDMRTAETFAARAAVAVDLSQRVARDSLRRVVGAQELERARLARELHDETGQALMSILLGLKTVEESRSAEEMRTASATLRELVVATLQDVRRLAVELHPKALDDFGLVAALERLTSEFSAKTGIAVELEAALRDERLPVEVETALYRLVQEALTNVVKHAHATRVSIVLTRKERSVAAVVEDDGRGFAPGDDSEGLGLVGMKERVGLLDGRFEIESTERAGTTIVVEIPLR